jgi:hypothetical protein
MSEPGQKQRGGGTGGAGADHDDVVARAIGRHCELTPDLLVSMGVNTRPTAHGQCWEGPLKRHWSGAAV